MFRRSFIILLLVLMSCTEKVSIEPEFTNNTDWVPLLTVEHNNYRRVELNLGELPRLEVERNLSRILVQFRTVGEPEFQNLDTLDLEFERFLRPRYLSEPVLQENVEYEFHVVAQYRSGFEQVSNTVRFITPVVRGQILDSTAIPLPDEYPNPLTGFTFGENFVLVLTHSYALIRIDRNTLEITQLFPYFVPNSGQFRYFPDMTVHGDTAIFSEYPRDEPNKMTVVQLNLRTLEIDRSLIISFPKEGSFFYGRVFYYSNSDMYVLWDLGGEQQIEKINSVTGQVIESYKVFDSLVEIDDALVFDGTDFWIGINGEFDNRIVGFDPNGAIIPPFHRNPVFRSFALAWDGDSFWVFDDETDSLVKLKLEGL